MTKMKRKQVTVTTRQTLKAVRCNAAMDRCANSMGARSIWTRRAYEAEDPSALNRSLGAIVTRAGLRAVLRLRMQSPTSMMKSSISSSSQKVQLRFQSRSAMI